MFVKNKNMNGVRGNRKEIITLINNIKNENSMSVIVKMFQASNK